MAVVVAPGPSAAAAAVPAAATAGLAAAVSGVVLYVDPEFVIRGTLLVSAPCPAARGDAERCSSR